jgi:hypothetical protein
MIGFSARSEAKKKKKWYEKKILIPECRFRVVYSFFTENRQIKHRPYSELFVTLNLADFSIEFGRWFRPSPDLDIPTAPIPQYWAQDEVSNIWTVFVFFFRENMKTKFRFEKKLPLRGGYRHRCTRQKRTLSRQFKFTAGNRFDRNGVVLDAKRVCTTRTRAIIILHYPRSRRRHAYRSAHSGPKMKIVGQRSNFFKTS